MAQASEMVDRPRMKILAASTMRAPYLSTSHPTPGDTAEAASPPKLAAPAISVRLQPNSSESGKIKTAMVRLAVAFRTTWVLLAVQRMTQP